MHILEGARGAGLRPGDSQASVSESTRDIDWSAHGKTTPGIPLHSEQSVAAAKYGLKRCYSLREDMNFIGTRRSLYLPAHTAANLPDEPPSYQYEGDAHKFTRLQKPLYPFLQF